MYKKKFFVLLQPESKKKQKTEEDYAEESGDSGVARKGKDH